MPPGRLVADSRLCRDCQACLLACSLEHEAECSPRLARLAVEKDMARYEFQVRVCLHCEPAPCAQACPSEAIRPDARGVLVIDPGDCVLCGECAEACPESVIVYDARRERYLKCDLCPGQPAPLCAALCPVGAIRYEAAVAEVAR
jgi:Fe-S-cluster-containing hydrogenase component 2